MITELLTNESLPVLLDRLAFVLSIVYGGAIVLTLVLAFALRFAVAPLVESTAVSRRIGAVNAIGSKSWARNLEEEIDEIRRAIASLADGLEFDRKLGPGWGAARPPAQDPSTAMMRDT